MLGNWPNPEYLQFRCTSSVTVLPRPVKDWYSQTVYLDEIDSSVDPPSAVNPAVPNTPQLLNRQREGLKTRIRAFGEVVLCSDFPTQLMLIQLLA